MSLPTQEKIDKFIEMLNEGWSYTLSMGVARLKWKEYTAILEEYPEIKKLVEKQRRANIRGKKVEY